MAKIDVNEADGTWALVVQGEVIMTANCVHVLERVARLMHQARQSPPRQAMRILTEEVGMCDDYASALCTILHGGAHQTIN